MMTNSLIHFFHELNLVIVEKVNTTKEEDQVIPEFPGRSEKTLLKNFVADGSVQSTFYLLSRARWRPTKSNRPVDLNP